MKYHKQMNANEINLFIKTVLRGIGQIMLQENAFTGLLFLVGIFYGSVAMGIGTLLAAMTGTATAHLFKFNKDDRTKGLYGFSPALVGAAVILFLKPVFMSWIIVLLGAVLAALLQRFFIRQKIPAFTFPFVVTTWLILYLIKNTAPGLMAETTPIALPETANYTFAFKGYGQVIFQDAVASGILFFAAVFISSPIAALYGLFGAVISGILAVLFSVPVEPVAAGLFSYNAVLCAIVFAGKDRKALFWAVFSVMLSLGISISMFRMEWVALTFPFVLASFVSLKIKEMLPSKKA